MNQSNTKPEFDEAKALENFIMNNPEVPNPETIDLTDDFFHPDKSATNAFLHAFCPLFNISHSWFIWWYHHAKRCEEQNLIEKVSEDANLILTNPATKEYEKCRQIWLLLKTTSGQNKQPYKEQEPKAIPAVDIQGIKDLAKKRLTEKKATEVQLADYGKADLTKESGLFYLKQSLEKEEATLKYAQDAIKDKGVHVISIEDMIEIEERIKILKERIAKYEQL